MAQCDLAILFTQLPDDLLRSSACLCSRQCAPSLHNLLYTHWLTVQHSGVQKTLLCPFLPLLWGFWLFLLQNWLPDCSEPLSTCPWRPSTVDVSVQILAKGLGLTPLYWFCCSQNLKIKLFNWIRCILFYLVRKGSVNYGQWNNLFDCLLMTLWWLDSAHQLIMWWPWVHTNMQLSGHPSIRDMSAWCTNNWQ